MQLKNLFTFYFLLFTFLISLLSSCNKSLILKENLTSEQLSLIISEDADFSNYISIVKIIFEKSINSPVLSESDFAYNFEKAVSSADLNSKVIIGKAMGFEFSDLFWEDRKIMISALKNLSQKYNLSKLTEKEWITLIKNKIRVLKNSENLIMASQSIGGPGMGELCIAKYNNCMDQALALYAGEQVVCVAFGGLGWTGVGIGLYLACEASSWYHLKTMQKGCDIDFRICVIK